MTKKQVWLYTCDFCKKKKGRSSGHMKRHEQSCTLNPNRICRMCNLRQEVQKPISELLSLLPNPSEFPSEEYHFEESPLTKAVNAVLPALRAACNDCPACIMAALRQKKILVPVATDFDYAKESKAMFEEINSEMSANDWC